MTLKAPRYPSNFPFVDMGFLGESSKVAEWFKLLKEFKISKFRFVKVNLVKGGEKVGHLLKN